MLADPGRRARTSFFILGSGGRILQRNMETALVWANACSNPDMALRLCAALWPLWLSHGQLHEGYLWLETTLAQAIAPFLDALPPPRA